MGTLPKSEWNALDIYQKMEWYYHKTHALINAKKNLFSQYYEIKTEELNDTKTFELIQNLICKEAEYSSRAYHTNIHYGIANEKAEMNVKMQRFFHKLNLKEFEMDDVYPLTYVVKQFVAWNRGQLNGIEDIAGYRRSPDLIAKDLNRARNLLLEQAEIIDQMMETFSLKADKTNG